MYNYLNESEFTPFQYHEGSAAIDSLNSKKSEDHTGLAIEHIKFAHYKIIMIITLRFAHYKIIMIITLRLNRMMRHGYLPNQMMESIITPVIKNKKRGYLGNRKLQTYHSSQGSIKCSRKVITRKKIKSDQPQS